MFHQSVTVTVVLTTCSISQSQ